MVRMKKKQLDIKALEKRVMLDASLGALTTTTVIAENDANTSPQILDSDVTVTGTTTDFSGDALTVSTTGGIEDQLTINDEGTAAGQIGFDGSNVTYGGTLIGTLSSNGVNGTDLTIDLNANASKAAIERLIENVTYQNNSDDPTTNRTINFSLAAYFSEDVTVTIVAQNETPTLDTNTGLTLDEGDTDIITPAMLGASDPDNTDTDVTFTVTSAVTNGRLELTTNLGVAITSFTLDDLNNNRVQYVHDGSETTSDSFDFTITDGTGTTGTETFSITVNPIDEAPVIVTNNGADVSLGFSISLGGDAPTFGTERYRESGVGVYNSNQSLIDNQNSMFTLVFTTDSSTHTGNPGQVLFEDGGSGRGIGLYINSANELVWFSGLASSSPVLSSGVSLATSTQYAVVIEVDTDTDQIRMHYQQAGNFDWFSFGRTAEAQLNGYTDTNDLSGGNQGGVGVVGGGSYGGFNGSANGTTAFQGTIDSDFIVYDFPTGGGTPNTKLVATDVDDTSSDLIYTITDNVDFGTIYLDSTALGLNDTFTQNDLDTGRVTYDSVIGSDDQFTFSLFDGTNTIAGQTFDIRVNTVNNAPTLLTETIIYEEDFEGGTSGWNNNTTTTNTTLSEFWGRFNRNINVSGDQELFQTFSLSGTQEYVTVEFDFYEIDSWDNEFFYVFIDDQQVLNNHRYHHNTYDLEANSTNGDVTYRVQELTDGLGWIAYNGTRNDQVVTYSLTIKTTDTDFKLGFGTSLNATNFNDESFGIDNIRIKELSTGGTDRTFQVSELVPNNDQVGFAHALEPDIGQSLAYSVTGGTGAGIFSVDSSSGEIRVSDNSAIDFESGTTSYTLTVRATDNGPGLLFDEQTFTINILDALENTSPTFTGAGPFSIAEDAAVNDDVGTVITNDAEGDNVTYSIVSGNGDGIFKINSNTGLIEIANTTNLDFDRDDQYVIRIRATDDNDLAKFRDQNITINIIDVDEAPILNPEDVIETQNAGVIYSAATGNFYKLITTNLSFNAALANAPTEMLNGVAGHGLTITSAAEFAFIDSITPTHNWLALTDQDSEGNWYWVAGPEAGTQIVRDGNVRHPDFFNNWNSGEPNSGDARDFALMHQNDRWYDNWTGNYDSVVEWEGSDIINNDTYLVNHSSPDGSDLNVGDSVGFIQGLDPEGGTLDYTIEAGNTDGIFEIDIATGEIRILDTTNINATVTDSYTLTIRATETVGGKFAEIDVDVIFNDDFTISTNNPLTVPEGATVAITTAELNLTDIDNVATDTIFRVELSPANGRLELSTYPGFEISSFTFDDIQNGRVVYVHDGSQIPSDSFDFSVTDGGRVQTGNTFNINVTDVNFGASIDVNTGAAVVEGSNVTITQAMLDSSDPDIADTPDQLTYTASSLANGHIEVNGVIQNTFTQHDINNNLVEFIHDGSEGDGSFALSLADGLEDGAVPDTATFIVTKTDVNDAPVITTNNAVDVTEGQTVTITTADLNTTDPDDSGAGISYTLSGITNGFVELSTNPGVPIITFTQDDLDNNRVVFRHDGNEADARFDVMVSDGGENGAGTDTVTVNLNKIDVNDSSVLAVNSGSSINQNSILILNNFVLRASDSDDTPDGITFTVTGSTNGQVEFVSNPNVPITSFTQDDINNSRVLFRHSGPPTTASFDFTVADGLEDGAVSTSDTFSLSVDNVNDAPIISTNVPPTMDEGTTLVIDTTMLNSFDPDDFGTDLTWTVSGLSNGILQVNGVTQNTFTQADLDAGLVTFTHDGTETTVAGFNVSLEDGGEDGATPDTGTFAINVTPVNDNVTLTGDLTMSLNEGGSVTITTTDLNMTDPDDGPGDVTYTVSDLSNGHIEVGGVVQNTFTLQDIINGDVDFVHDGSETLTAGFDISLADGLENGTVADTGSMSISVSAVNDAPLTATNNGVTVNEGATVTISTAELTTSDADTAATSVIFDVTSTVTNGRLELSTNVGVAVTSFTLDDLQAGRVQYVHNGTETLVDSFDFTIRDDLTTLPADTFNITVTPQNDDAIITGDLMLAVNEGGTVTLSTTDLGMTDPDDGASDVIYTASNLSNGHIEVGGVVQNTFTLQDIINGDVDFVHDGGESVVAGFDISLADGLEHGAVADLASMTVTVTPVNDMPTAISLSSTNVLEAKPVGTIIGRLSSVDVDLPGDSFTYTITADPDSKFAIVGDDLVLNDNVDYEVQTSHSVTIRTDDGNGGTFDQIFTINVLDNVAPTDLHLDNTSVEENSETGRWVGNLTVTDANQPSDVITYTLMSNPDSMFMISGNQLLVQSATIDFEVTPMVDIMVRATDLEGNEFDRLFMIEILDLAEFSGDGFIEPETLSRILEADFSDLQLDSESGQGSLLQATLSDKAFGQLRAFYGESEQIIRTNTTERIRDILGLQESVILPRGVIPAQSFEQQLQNTIEGAGGSASEYTNIREAIAFLSEIESTQTTNASSSVVDQYDVNNQFVDVLTYHEQRQEKLREALSD